MKVVMIITRLTGQEENDRVRAAEYCRFAAHKGVLPVSPYLNFGPMSILWTKKVERLCCFF